MEISEIGALQIAKKAEAILHVPGNYRGGILEMTIVLDTSLEKVDFSDALTAVLKALKRKQDIFGNVRLNLVYWEEETITAKVVPMTLLQTGSPLGDYRSSRHVKKYEELFAYLKKFHARSKLILLFTDGQNKVKDIQAAKDALTPFLKNKLLILSDQVIGGTQFFLQMREA